MKIYQEVNFYLVLISGSQSSTETSNIKINQVIRLQTCRNAEKKISIDQKIFQGFQGFNNFKNQDSNLKKQNEFKS